MKRLLSSILLLASLSEVPLLGQATNVPVYPQGRRDTQEHEALLHAAEQLRAERRPLAISDVGEQLRRTHCTVELPAVSNHKLSNREIWERARSSHLRVGWSYLCNKCEHWHLTLAGGFAVSSNGVAVTCYHVVQPKSEMKTGSLVAANEAGKLFAVTEVLAANRAGDTCVIQLDGAGFTPLPLNTNVVPGDAAYCFSDPLDRRGYFSQGIVNRFYTLPGRRRLNAPESATLWPTRLHVSTDWAPGSSGSAVLDECGNAIGFVSTIAAAGDEDTRNTGETPKDSGTYIVFHEAVAARDVLTLIKPKP